MVAMFPIGASVISTATHRNYIFRLGHLFIKPLEGMSERKIDKLGAKGREHVIEEIAKRCGFLYDDI